VDAPAATVKVQNEDYLNTGLENKGAFVVVAACFGQPPEAQVIEGLEHENHDEHHSDYVVFELPV
jgi:hypothetical protein